MRTDIKHGRNIVKYKKGEIPKIYDSALTCFETISYTYYDKGRIKGAGASISGHIYIASVSMSTHSKLFKIKLYIIR